MMNVIPLPKFSLGVFQRHKTKFLFCVLLLWPVLRFAFCKIIRKLRKLPPGPDEFFLLFNNIVPNRKRYLRELFNEFSERYGPVCYFSFGTHNVAMISDPTLARELFSHVLLDRYLPFFHPADQPDDLSWKNGEEWSQRRGYATSTLFRAATTSYVTTVMNQSLDKYLIPEIAKSTDNSTLWEPRETINFLTWNMTYACIYGYSTSPDDEMYCANAMYENKIPKSWNVIQYGYEHVKRKISRKIVNLWWDQSMTAEELFPSFRRRTHLHSGCNGSYLDRIFRRFGTDVAYGEMQAMLDSHESVSNSIEFTLAYIAKNPMIQQELREEMKAVVVNATETIPTPNDDGEANSNGFVHIDVLSLLKRLPRLQAFVHESLRISGTGSSGIPRTSGPQDLWINGYRIPKNTMMFANADYMQRRDSKLWKNAAFNKTMDEFCLENWLEKDEETGQIQFVCPPEKAFFSFGVGKRSCPGKMMSLYEIYCVLGQLVWNYQIEAADKTENPHYDEFLQTVGSGIQRLVYSPCFRVTRLVTTESS